MQAAAIGLALAAMTSLARAQAACDRADLGCAIFNGQHPMTAHLRDDDRPLPAWTTRCVNCHADTPKAQAFAPPLTHDSLLGAASRRGGPVSHYDETAFCRAVKDGVDPAGVLLRKSMPHYRMADAECMALWRFVVQR
ncbi:hypothetical protein AWB76_02857 [Caballeronia temeraria]|uniref:Cytochrome c domain-containing protein n=2 Tax=Caballeronia temeraria TaxID=1777137 RepID=A0A158AQE2_9BURK|nr:hypothetical protein AWB76_02857 [Caballeronia temeraria]